MAEAAPRYPGGELVQPGDAVLLDEALGARVESIQACPVPTVHLVQAHAKLERTLSGAELGRLLLVAREPADFKRAIYESLLARAAAGDASAYYALYYTREECQGARIGVERQLAWLEKGASMGHAKAQAQLGFMYSWGVNLPRLGDKAVHWYLKAAAQGDAKAQFGLGCHYEQGLGVPADAAEAVRWYSLAAAQGHGGAICNLADKYEKGLGVAQDLALAARLYRRAAEGGVTEAMTSLAAMYAEGRGVQRDPAEAQRWMRLGQVDED